MKRNILFLLVVWLVPSLLVAQTEGLFADSDELANDTLTADTMAVDSLSEVSDRLGLPWPQNVAKRLDALLRHSMFETSQVGIMVYDLTADSVIFTHGERQMLRPASTMKLVTAIAAIDRLGESYQFRTSLYYKGKISEHVLSGDVY